jgi:hypothetical protein
VFALLATLKLKQSRLSTNKKGLTKKLYNIV